VYYYLFGTSSSVAASVTGYGAVDSNVTVNALSVPGYTVVGSGSITETLDITNNVFTFYYDVDINKPVEYVVHYYLVGTSTSVAPDKVVSGQTMNSTVTESAVPVAGYTALAPTTLTGVLNATGNVFVFYYSLDQYSIVYELNSGDNNSTNPSGYAVEDLPVVIGNPFKAGYVFEGWTVAYADGQSNVIAPVVSYSIPVGTVGAIVLTAHWINGTSCVHNYFGVVVSPASCTSEGLKVYVCLLCTDYYFESIEKFPHVFETLLEVVVPSCEGEGYAVYKCLCCNETEKRDFVAPIGHNYFSFVVTPPSCSSEGLMASVCLRCTNYHVESIAKLNHTYESIVTLPSCVEQGYTIFTCSVCGYNYTDNFVDALGHDWQVTQIVTPTCDAAGYTVYECLRCGETRPYDFVAPLGHNYFSLVVISATCSSEGSMLHLCLRCTHNYFEPIAKLDHTYVSVVTAPTCTEQGYTTHICTNNDAHNYIDNYTQPHGHNFIEIPLYYPTVVPPCDEYWERIFECTYCHITYSIPFQPLFVEHNYVAVIYLPSCTNDGFTIYVCIRCGDSYIADFMYALGHDWDDGVVIVEANYEIEGLMLFTCNFCGETRTEVIPRL